MLELREGELHEVQVSLMPSSVPRLYCFVSYHCPISIYQIPKLKRLISEYPSVDVLLVVPELEFNMNDDFTKSDLHDLKAKLVIDVNLELTKRLKATVTPQYVLVSNGRVCYSGKFDNQNKQINIPSFDKDHVNFVESAIGAVLKGQVPTISSTVPVGCLIE